MEKSKAKTHDERTGPVPNKRVEQASLHKPTLNNPDKIAPSLSETTQPYKTIPASLIGVCPTHSISSAGQHGESQIQQSKCWPSLLLQLLPPDIITSNPTDDTITHLIFFACTPGQVGSALHGPWLPVLTAAHLSAPHPTLQLSQCWPWCLIQHTNNIRAAEAHVLLSWRWQDHAVGQCHRPAAVQAPALPRPLRTALPQQLVQVARQGTTQVPAAVWVPSPSTACHR